MSHTRLYREYITSSEMYSLHLTHPKWTHTRSSGQPCYSARGAVGGSVSCSRTPQSLYWRRKEHWLFTPPTYNPCRTWDSNPQPLDYESDSLTIRPRLPTNGKSWWLSDDYLMIISRCIGLSLDIMHIIWRFDLLPFFPPQVSKIAAYAYSAISQIKVDAKEELVVQFAIPWFKRWTSSLPSSSVSVSLSSPFTPPFSFQTSWDADAHVFVLWMPCR